MIVKETERAEEKKEKQKKKQKQNIKRRNERKNIEFDSPKIASEMPWRCPRLFFWRILLQNRQVPKGVGTEMRALVASWGLLLHDEGAWGAVEGCRGLFGRQFGGSRVPKKKFYNFEEPSQHPKTAKRAPKCPPRRPQMSPREPQGTRKSIFLAKTLIYQK